jgi:hypothetical protein
MSSTPDDGAGTGNSNAVPLDIDFDAIDASGLEQEAALFGMDVDVVVPMPAKVPPVQSLTHDQLTGSGPVTNLISCLTAEAYDLTAKREVNKTLKDYLTDTDVLNLVGATLQVFDGTHPLVASIRNLLTRYAEVLLTKTIQNNTQIQGTLCLEMYRAQQLTIDLCNSYAPRASVAAAASKPMERIQLLERRLAAVRSVLMLFKIIAVYHNWPGASNDWYHWFNRFSKYYTIAKGR